MPTVTFVNIDGSKRTVAGSVGDSVMSVAVRNGVPGIVGECGGNTSCGTCHVYVDEHFQPLVGPPTDLEEDLLDLGVSDRRPASRLSCQIALTDELDGLIVTTPSDQS